MSKIPRASSTNYDSNPVCGVCKVEIRAINDEFCIQYSACQQFVHKVKCEALSKARCEGRDSSNSTARWLCPNCNASSSTPKAHKSADRIKPWSVTKKRNHKECTESDLSGKENDAKASPICVSVMNSCEKKKVTIENLPNEMLEMILSHVVADARAGHAYKQLMPLCRMKLFNALVPSLALKSVDCYCLSSEKQNSFLQYLSRSSPGCTDGRKNISWVKELKGLDKDTDILMELFNDATSLERVSFQEYPTSIITSLSSSDSKILPKLKHLEIRSIGRGSATLKGIADCAWRLTSLTLRGFSANNISCSADCLIPNLGGIEELGLVFRHVYHHYDTKMIEAIAKYCVNVKKLELYHLDDNDVEELCSSDHAPVDQEEPSFRTSIEVITVDHGHITSASIPHLEYLPNLKRLKIAVLRYRGSSCFNNLTDALSGGIEIEGLSTFSDGDSDFTWDSDDYRRDDSRQYYDDFDDDDDEEEGDESEDDDDQVDE